jgi:hypothetical protein
VENIVEALLLHGDGMPGELTRKLSRTPPGSAPAAGAHSWEKVTVSVIGWDDVLACPIKKITLTRQRPRTRNSPRRNHCYSKAATTTRSPSSVVCDFASSITWTYDGADLPDDTKKLIGPYFLPILIRQGRRRRSVTFLQTKIHQ